MAVSPSQCRAGTHAVDPTPSTKPVAQSPHRGPTRLAMQDWSRVVQQALCRRHGRNTHLHARVLPRPLHVWDAMSHLYARAGVLTVTTIPRRAPSEIDAHVVIIGADAVVAH